jgi:hypothetical protein
MQCVASIVRTVHTARTLARATRESLVGREVNHGKTKGPNIKKQPLYRPLLVCVVIQALDVLIVR